MWKWFDRWSIERPIALIVSVTIGLLILALIVSFFITWAFLGPPPFWN